MAEYEELNKREGNLLSTVSHELRTHLTVMKWHSSMLLSCDRRLRRDEKRECVEAIDKGIDELTELVKRLLDTPRLEAGLLKPSRQRICQSHLEGKKDMPGHFQAKL